MNGSGGNDSWDGQSDIYNSTTGSGPKLSIKNATGTVNVNGAVHIADGVYNGTDNRNITIGKNMNIMGQSRNGTVIDGLNTVQIFNIQSGVNITIHDLTITNGRSTYGGAIYNIGNLAIANSTFNNNTASFGGSIYNSYGDLTIANTTLNNNTAISYGGAVLNYIGNLAIVNSTFSNNTAYYGGAVLNYDGDLTIANTVLSNNNAAFGGAIYNYYGNIAANFNRIVGNTANQGSAIYNDGTVDAEKNWWGSNADPKTISNLIIVYGGSVNTDTWVILTVHATPNTINNGQTTTITADLNHINRGDPLTGGHIPDGPVTFSSTLGTLNPVSAFTINGEATTTFTPTCYSGIGTVNVTVDGFNLGTPINVTNAEIYVSNNTGSDISGDGSQSNPYQTILKGINLLSTGGNLHIADGTYTGVKNTNIPINKNMNIMGQSRDETIIDAQGLSQIFNILSGINFTIQNLTLINGKAPDGISGANPGNGSSGGAIYNNGTLNVINTIFLDNKAGDGGDCTVPYINGGYGGSGGAICNNGTLNVINSIFSGNKAGAGGDAISGINTLAGPGGAIYNEGGNCTVTGCTFTDNTAGTGGAIHNYRTNCTVTGSNFNSNNATYMMGGAIFNEISSIMTISGINFTNNHATGFAGSIYNQGNLTINNCHFTNNTANINGGAIHNNGTLIITNTTLQNNTANYGGAIYNTGNLTTNFNRIVGNTANQGKAIYNSVGIVNAENNWWGSNKDPKTISNLIIVANGSVNTYTWVILTVNATPNTIKNSETSNITADFNHINGGGDLTGGHIPDDILVTFTTAWGSFTQNLINTLNGESSTTFRADGVSFPTTNPLKIYAAADSETNTYTPVNIIVATIITADNITSFPGQNVTLTAHVNDSYNNPLNVGNITFKVNGTTIGTVDVTSGQSTTNWTIPTNWNAGKYEILAEYSGTSDYQSNSTNSTLTLNHIPTNITINPVSGYKGDNVTLTVKIQNTINNITLHGKIIDFYLNGTKIGSNTTDANGTSTYIYTILENIGTYNITAIFNEDEQFGLSNNTNTLTVNATPTKLTLNETLAYKGKTIKLTATLWDNYNKKALTNQKVTFKVSGVVIGTATTNANGIATLNYKDLTGKTRTITAEYIGDNCYANSQASKQMLGEKIFTLTVKNTGTTRIHAVYYVTVYLPGATKPIFKKYKFFLNPGKSIKINIGTYTLGTAVSTDQFVYNTASTKKTVSLTNTWTAQGLKAYVQKFAVKNVPAKQARAVYAKNRFWINKNKLNLLIVRKPALR